MLSLRSADAFVKADAGKQFVQVLQAVFVLVLPDHLLVAGAVQEAVQQVADPMVPGILPGIFNKADERLGLGIGPQFQGAVQGDAAFGSREADLVQEFPAQLPGGDVDDALEAEIVVLVQHQAKVTESVLDLFPFEETGASPDGVFQPGIQQGLLQSAGLVGTPVQDGDVIYAGAALQ